MNDDEVGDIFKNLDAYNEDKIKDIDIEKLEECYKKAIKFLKDEIEYNELFLKRTDVKWGNEYESDVNPECYRCDIVLLEDRLYQLSLDGELGQKLQLDERFHELNIKTYQELRNEIDENIINKTK